MIAFVQKGAVYKVFSTTVSLSLNVLIIAIVCKIVTYCYRSLTQLSMSSGYVDMIDPALLVADARSELAAPLRGFSAVGSELRSGTPITPAVA